MSGGSGRLRLWLSMGGGQSRRLWRGGGEGEQTAGSCSTSGCCCCCVEKLKLVLLLQLREREREVRNEKIDRDEQVKERAKTSGRKVERGTTMCAAHANSMSMLEPCKAGVLHAMM